jgi:hypothetical protein
MSHLQQGHGDGEVLGIRGGVWGTRLGGCFKQRGWAVRYVAGDVGGLVREA